MEEVYGLMSYQQLAPPADAAGDNRHRAFVNQSPEVRQKRRTPGNNNSNSSAEQLEEDVSTANRAKIISHPLYPNLLQAYIVCQKVGAPADVANLFNEIFRENDLNRRSSSSSCLGDDPELDEFMETYCEMLDRYRSDLARPFDEATTFLNNMQTQLNNLCSVTNHSEMKKGSTRDPDMTRQTGWLDFFQDLDDMNIEIMRNTLYNAYLEDFYRIFQKLGGATAEIMSDLLAFEGDRRVVNITINRCCDYVEIKHSVDGFQLGVISCCSVVVFDSCKMSQGVRDAMNFDPKFEEYRQFY